jgi:Ca2+-binding RTX toxin-like protein
MPNSAPSGSVQVLSQMASTTTRPLNASDITDASTQFYWDPAQGGNGHIYKFVNKYLHWDTAVVTAQNSSLSGVSGYLVTITSAEEQNFISTKLSNFNVWIGASDAAVEGTWRWVTGPEAGLAIGYDNWAATNPNSYNGENYGILWAKTWSYLDALPSGWHDFRIDGQDQYDGPVGYAVEYSGLVTVNVPGIAATGSAFTQGRTIYADGGQISDPDGLGTLAWQWQRSNDNGSTWNDITDATARSYTLVSADVGKLVRTVALYVDGGGTLERVFSSASTKVVRLPNNAPVIISNGGGDSARIAVLENASAVTTVSATDADAGTTLRYAIVGGADAALFSINATTGALRFKSAADFESPKDSGVDNVYDVVVQVSDGSLSDRQSITITVQDIANELLVGTSRAETLTGAGGNDTLKGGSGNDTLLGNAGNDVLDGGKGIDRMEGGAGNDTYIVDSVGDVVIEDSGNGRDTVKASVSYALAAHVENLSLTGSATLGGRGNDLANIIIGNAGTNILMGFAGNDNLKGGSGSDTLHGGVGKDVLTGGTGQDFFVFDTAASAANVDKIIDFNFGDNDKVQLSKAVYQGINHLGSLTSDEFYAAAGATKARDSTDRVIYDTTSGKLFYDADGFGGAAAVQIAVLGSSAPPVLIYSDIQIIA